MNRNKVGRVLSGLHCFSHAARCLSFTKAGEILSISQSAVSHRIRNLEDQLGFTLFQRLPRRILLTEEGKRLFAVLESSLDEIGKEINFLQNQELSGALNVTATPALSSCWLVPRLIDFAVKFPDISLHLWTRNDLVNFGSESVDIAIYYGEGNHPGLDVTLLMDEKILPVCTREYAEEHDLFGNPDALGRCVLLHDNQPWPNAQYFSEWKAWMDFANVNKVNFRTGHSLDRSDLAVAWAMDGGGVAIGRQRLVQRKFDTGELVDPFGVACESPQAYYLVSTRENGQTARVAAFREWLMTVVA